MKAVFIRKRPETKTHICSFFFKPERKIDFIAGQYTELTLPSKAKHWFTISSSPDVSGLSITTRLTGSDFKNELNGLTSGQEVDLAAAMGDFVLPIRPTRPVLMVAGGIGITPFLSILKYGLKHPSEHNLHLLYAASEEADFIDIGPYSRLLAGYEKFVGRLSAKDILAEADLLTEPYIYTSGPEPMVEKLIKDLKASGIAENRLVADYFPGYE